MLIPSMPVSLMYRVYRQVLPQVHRELFYWKSRAEEIPNAELRKQALASIEHGHGHLVGGHPHLPHDILHGATLLQVQAESAIIAQGVSLSVAV